MVADTEGHLFPPPPEWGNREQHCVEGKEGKHLLRKSVKRARKLGVERSATILLNERIIWCVRISLSRLLVRPRLRARLKPLS